MSDFIPLTQEEKDRDGHDGYLVAIAEKRRRGIVAGEIEPLNDEERDAAFRDEPRTVETHDPRVLGRSGLQATGGDDRDGA